VVRAQEYRSPAETATIPPRSELFVESRTLTGEADIVVDAFPRLPDALYPQHLTPVPAVTAQAWKSPMLTATTPLSGLALLGESRTLTGEDWEVLLPFPNCEYWL